MSVLDDPRVTRNGNDFHVRISHGRYLVEEDDRTQPPLWWVFDESGLRVCAVGSTDPLRNLSPFHCGVELPEQAINTLLACDGSEVPA